jgi:hypothetical protein
MWLKKALTDLGFENFRNAPQRIIQSHTWEVELGRFE